MWERRERGRDSLKGGEIEETEKKRGTEGQIE